jgi:hypothetical protein
LLLVLVLGTVALITIRAARQNLTGDEASTYTRWVEPIPPRYWVPDSNNHVLNSLLISLSTEALGGTPFAIRLPALLAGALFCVLAGLLLGEIHGASYRGALGFVLLVLCPFVLDYLFAARGYSMALTGELVVFLCVWRHLSDPEPFKDGLVERRFLLASTAAGLAAAAQYAFIPMLLVTLGLFYLLVLARCRVANGMVGFGRWSRWLAMAFLPASGVVGLVCGDNLARFPTATLTWGTYSLVGFLHSIAERVFEPPNPLLVPPHLQGSLAWVADHGVAIVLFVMAATGLAIGFERRREWFGTRWFLAADSDADRSLIFSGYCLAAALLTVLGLEAMMHVAGIRLPIGRPALMLMVPLGLVVTTLPLAPPSCWPGRLRRALASCALAVAGLSFLGALRLSYFQEWSYDADVREATWVAGTYMRSHQVGTIGTTWHFKSTAVYYKKLLGFDFISLAEDDPEKLRAGREIYFVPPEEVDFISEEHLRVLCVGSVSEMRVAIREESSTSPSPAGSPGFCAVGLEDSPYLR